MKKMSAQKMLPGMVAMAAGYTMKTRPGPSVATSLMGRPVACAMYPSTEKITKPDTKLVAELMTLVKRASLDTHRIVTKVAHLNVVWLLVDVVVVLVVRGVGQQHAKPGPQREEDLSGGIYPHLGGRNDAEVGLQIVADALS